MAWAQVLSPHPQDRDVALATAAQLWELGMPLPGAQEPEEEGLGQPMWTGPSRGP